MTELQTFPVGDVPETITPDERTLVKQYAKDIEASRHYDRNARRDYAFCRRYARGDSSWSVDINLIGTYIDILVAFLYARDPDIDVLVSESAGQARKRDAGQFAKTLQTVMSRAWKDARMKRQAERWIRSVLTTGIGWLKLGWQERYETDPEMVSRKRDIQENLARIADLRGRIESGDVDDLELEQRQLEEQLAGLEGHVEKLVYRGLFIDLVPAEDIAVSLDVQNVVDCESASWMAHRNYLPLEVAKARFPRIPEDVWTSAVLYSAIEPTHAKDRTTTAHVDDTIDETTADRFEGAARTGGGGGANRENRFVCVWEMWRGDTNRVYDMIEGIGMFASEPAEPNVGTTRFYPFFPLAFHEVDNERHPQSLVMRSYKLADEYNRTRTGYADLRGKVKPKIGFDARLFTDTEIKKITDGTYAEFVPIKPAIDGAGVNQGFAEIPYPQINPALFDTSPIRVELETLWGIQEALAGSIQVAKTATEAEIQQAGTNARTGAMRDRAERVMTEMALTTAEILVQKLDSADAREIAGPEAIWIDDMTVEDLDLLVNIEIRAGSTGKPNTAAQRDAWAVEAGILEGTIEKVAALLQTPPDQLASCLWELAIETAERTGDRMDLERFRPQPGQPVPLIDPATGQVVPAYPAPQPGGTLGGQAAPDVAPMPAPGDPGMPQGEAVAPSDLPPQFQS